MQRWSRRKRIRRGRRCFHLSCHKTLNSGSPVGAGGAGGAHLAEAVPVLGAAHARVNGKAADHLPVGVHKRCIIPVRALVVELNRYGDVRPDLRDTGRDGGSRGGQEGVKRGSRGGQEGVKRGSPRNPKRVASRPKALTLRNP
eukprot:1191547-Prorocentrum_minimum.AAC.1